MPQHKYHHIAPQFTYITIGTGGRHSDNPGVTSDDIVRCQGIIRINDDPVPWRHMASLSHSESDLLMTQLCSRFLFFNSSCRAISCMPSSQSRFYRVEKPHFIVSPYYAAGVCKLQWSSYPTINTTIKHPNERLPNSIAKVATVCPKVRHNMGKGSHISPKLNTKVCTQVSN